MIFRASLFLLPLDPSAAAIGRKGALSSTRVRDFDHRRIQTSVVCDEIDGSTCIISSDRSWIGDTIISPSQMTNGLGQTISGVNEFILTHAATFTCRNSGQATDDEDFCKIHFKDYQRTLIAGTIKAPDVNIQGEIVSIDGKIDGTGLGYSGRLGPSPGETVEYGNHGYGGGASGASHGGKGGNSKDCARGDRATTGPTYGELDAPTGFGSGGSGLYGASDSAGGGRVFVEATEEVTLNGEIYEDAAPCVDLGTTTINRPLACGAASGGSVWIKAPIISGQGIIKAQGGNVEVENPALETFAFGGGGRVALHGNSISPFLDVDVRLEDQPESQPCTNGEPGTVHQQCLTTVCFNGGSIREGSCFCDCPEPDRFGGEDCSQCQITQCNNGGDLDAYNCRCNCPEGFMGASCDVCDSDILCNGGGVCNNEDLSCSCSEGYFGETCETFCDPFQTCNGKGVCGDTGICECQEGKYGDDCSCEVLDCSVDNTCSAHGVCIQGGGCSCDQGWTGCNCDIQCSSSYHCSGHGSCRFDGSCECDRGWEGESCSDQDLDLFCNGNNRVSEFPCLPGVVDYLGYGYNAVQGMTTQKLVPLTFSPGNTFTLDGTTYIIPDNVSCKPVTTTTDEVSSQSFSKADDFRRGLSASLGLSGRKYHNAYMSASAEYTNAVDQSFKENRRLYLSSLDHGLYSCELSDIGVLSDSAKKVLEDYSGDRRVRKIGTHVVTKANYGGRITVLNFVNSCVFEKSSATGVQADLTGSFYSQAGSGSADGDVEYFAEDTCSLLAANTRYSKSIDGGEHDLLFAAADSGNDTLRSWINSVEGSPAKIGVQLDDIDLIISDGDFELDLEDYLVAAEEDLEWDNGQFSDPVQQSSEVCSKLPEECSSSSPTFRSLSKVLISVSLLMIPFVAVMIH